MNRIPKATYTKEFREEAVKLAHDVGSSEAARRLSISIKTLANWLRADKTGKLAKVGSAQRPVEQCGRRHGPAAPIRSALPDPSETSDSCETSGCIDR